MSTGLWIGTLASSLAAGGDFESIATVTVGAGGASSVSFSSIPSGYQNLQIRASWRSSSAAEIAVRFNSDTNNSNYHRHILYGSGVGVAAGYNQLSTVGGYYEVGTNTFTGSIMDILDYTSTSKNTVTRCLYGFDNNGSGYVGINSSVWMNTAAVTNIALVSTGSPFSQYSVFALYGVKAP